MDLARQCLRAKDEVSIYLMVKQFDSPIPSSSTRTEASRSRFFPCNWHILGACRQELPLHDRPVSEAGQFARTTSNLGFLSEVMVINWAKHVWVCQGLGQGIQ